MIVPSYKGLGSDVVTSCDGEVIDCSLWSNLFKSACWGILTPCGQASVPGNFPNPPVPGQGAGTQGVIDYNNLSTLVTGVQENPQSAIDTAISSQTQQNQTETQSFFSNLDTGSRSGCAENLIQGICDKYVYIALGVGLLTVMMSGQGYRGR